MDSEAGVFAMAFDHSGTRLITAEADKTIKLYREDDTAVSTLSVFKINPISFILSKSIFYHFYFEILSRFAIYYLLFINYMIRDLMVFIYKF